MAELPGIERETLELDVVIVGGGPGGIAAALHLGQLIRSHNESGVEIKLPDLSIAVLEKGQEIGAHGLSGAVLDPRALDELIPGWRDMDCPVVPVGGDEMWYLTETGRIKAPFMPPPLQNHGNYVASLSELLRWMEPMLGDAGIDVFPEFPASRILIENGTVVGVRTADKGIDRNGEAKGNFEPGVDIRAKLTILAEGPRGTVTKQLADELDLYEGKNPQVYAVGVKEIWEVPEGRMKPGDVIHTMGWPLDSNTFGGAFIYAMKDGLVDIGLVVGLDYRNPTLDPHNEFQQLKLHPSIKAILDGGKMVAAGAKAIPEGGYFAMPKLYGNGFMIVGDSASFLNGARLKGIHLAMKSGMLAAEAAFEALKKADFSEQTLTEYDRRFEASWAKKELWKDRNFHQGFEHGQFAGIVNAGLALVTGGRGFGIFNRLEGQAGHERMERIQSYFGTEHPHPPEKVKFDNAYTFDKVTDVYYGGVTHEENQPAHLLIRDTEICITRCTEEYGNPCQHFCPAAVYEPKETEDGRGKVPFLNFTNCFHCKTCDIMDPYQIITWTTPEGGGGPNYQKL